MNVSDIEFIPNMVNAENISELSEKASRLLERRICEISELADIASELALSMLSDDYGIYETLSLISSGFHAGEYRIHALHMKENEAQLLAFMKTLSVHDKTAFSLLLSKKLQAAGKRISEEDFFEEKHTNSTVAFVKNSLSNEAYDVFSQEIEEPRLKYAKDMTETVSMLISGEAGYAILPLEERGGQRLKAVAELVFKEDLKINSVTPVFGPYGGADMKYALVSRCISVPGVKAGDDRYLEIRVKRDNSSYINDILTAADEYNIAPYRINTIDFETSEGSEPYYSLVLKLDSGDFADFLTYLTLFIQDYTTVGIYKNLE